MSAVFLKLFNMSVTASWLILAVLLVRLVLKKAPRWIACLLWALVAVRLVCPVSFESVLSLIPSRETIPANVAVLERPVIDSGIRIVNEAVNPVLSTALAPDAATGTQPVQSALSVISAVWAVGAAALLLFALFSYLQLRRRVSASVPAQDRVMICDEIGTPFILGLFRPKIYVPSSLDEQTLACVIRHEQAHLQRRDYWWKPLGYLLLAVYWFNPLCWLAYVLLCRDIEAACDEKVIRGMEHDEVASYSQALLDCGLPRRAVTACPLAFGETGVKARIKGILNYKRPAFWVILIALIVCVALAVFLMTDPFSGKELSGKLAVSMDMAVAGHFRTDSAEKRFAALDYDVLDVSRSGGETTVYAWVMYEEYSFDGQDVKLESGSHVPTAVTFDTSENGDSSIYDVIEYWEPRDGGYYEEDIQAKFPRGLWQKASDTSGADAQHEKCLQAAKEYFAAHPTEITVEDVASSIAAPSLSEDGRVFHSAFMGLSFAVPDGWTVLTLSELEGFNLPYVTASPEQITSLQLPYYEMVAFDGDNSSMMTIMIADLPLTSPDGTVIESAAQYIDYSEANNTISSQSYASVLGFNITQQERKTLRLTGRNWEYLSYTFSFEMQDSEGLSISGNAIAFDTITLITIAAEKGGYLYMISINSADSLDVEELLSHFYADE